MIIDFEALFLPNFKALVYKSVKAELHAIAYDLKACSLFGFPGHDPAQHDAYRTLLTDAEHFRLTVIDIPNIVDDPRTAWTDVFVAKPDQQWRLPALLQLRDLPDGTAWSDGLEWLNSTLLGYSPAQCVDWLSWRHDTGQSFAGRTVYLLLTETQLTGCHACGIRCLEAQTIADPLPIFTSKWPRAVRPDAINYLPQGTVLARAVIDREFYKTVFPPIPSVPDFRNTEIETSDFSKFNAALRSGIAIHDTDGWSNPDL